MSTIRRVLFPIDLSLCRRTLAATVRRMFDGPHAGITLLHVIEKEPWSSRGNELQRRMAQMEFFARKEFDSASVSRRIERGDPAARILDYIRENRVDVVVMPARGSSSPRRSALGHVTEEVLAHAPCPVLVDWTSGPGECARRVCCVVGLNESDEECIDQAAAAAAELGAELTIVHAVTMEPRKPASLLWDPGIRQREILLARVQVDALKRRLAPRADVQVEFGTADRVVSRAVLSQGCGLLVTAGTRETILAVESVCPVLRIAGPGVSSACAPEPRSWFAVAAGRSA